MPIGPHRARDDWAGRVRGADAAPGADADERRRGRWRPRAGAPSRPSARSIRPDSRRDRPADPLGLERRRDDQRRRPARHGQARALGAVTRGLCDQRGRRDRGRRSCAGASDRATDEASATSSSCPNRVSDRLEALAAKPGASKSAILDRCAHRLARAARRGRGRRALRHAPRPAVAELGRIERDGSMSCSRAWPVRPLPA